MAFQLVDIGINLMNKAFDSDREDIVSRAKDAGVARLIITGSSEAGSRAAADFAKNHPSSIRATAGIHPHEASNFSGHSKENLRALAGRPEVVAIGECGLDFNRNYSPPEAQERCLRAQLELAVELGMPVFLHEREAHRRFAAVLSEFPEIASRAVVHCFTGSAEELDAYLEAGFHIGITGWICDERRGVHLKSLVSRVPLDRLMLETDAPYLLPRDMRPLPSNRRNEPAFLPHILGAVSRAMGLSESEVAEATTANALRFFRWTGT